jgi:hypothetical protein
MRVEAFRNSSGPNVPYLETDHLVLAWHGQIAVQDTMDPEIVAEAVFRFLSQPDRPNAGFCRPLSKGDVITVHGRHATSFAIKSVNPNSRLFEHEQAAVFTRLRGVKAATPGEKSFNTRMYGEAASAQQRRRSRA